ncbi:MAG TPA: hypothetical protein VMZ06_16535 [Candidatus Bathyarchaeia archaeon]|nr:hypothetical protein [Candidatus Bathyarchaeia archaeon]
MPTDTAELDLLERQLDETARGRVAQAIDAIVAAKERGGKVAVVTGSGPNVHEGVTTLIAELIRAGIVDAVSTSSAVVAHEMGGTLDKVKRVQGAPLGVDAGILPLGGEFELTLMPDEALREIARQMPLDSGLIGKLKQAPGKTIIKAAGNLGYPMGLWLERLAQEIQVLARERGLTFEEVAGLGADPRTMIGMGARKGLPVLVTIPQLVGGGMVGLCVGDSISLFERSTRLAHILESADVIIESAVALTQEVHDGPFETHTGHGLWSVWQGHYVYSLKGKRLIRIDLDPALERVCRIEQEKGAVQGAIADGLPKTKTFNVPFRMEMSGFARHEGSTAVIGDIGVVWPLIARGVAQRLGVELEFMSWPQQTDRGKQMREWIVREVRPLDRARMLAELYHPAVPAD